MTNQQRHSHSKERGLPIPIHTSQLSILACTSIIILSLSTFLTLSSAHSSPHRPGGPRVAVHTSGTAGMPGVEFNKKYGDHTHYVPKRPVPGSKGQAEPILTHDKQLLHDKEHLKEDLGDWVFADGKELTPEEMEFHYFKMHDFDNNSMLDGLEILQAISHILPMTEVDGEEGGSDSAEKNEDSGAKMSLPPSPASSSTGTGSGRLNLESQKRRLEAEMKKAELVKQREEDFDYYIDLIDKVLKEDDLNKDGFLSYFEYVAGRRRDEQDEKAKAHQAAMHSHTQMS